MKGVRGLVRDKVLPFECMRHILASAENDVRSGSVRQRIQRARRSFSLLIGMHPHPAEVVPGSRFQAGASFGIERLPRGSQRGFNAQGKVVRRRRTSLCSRSIAALLLILPTRC
jgi:hypothetical protein